MTPEHPLYLEGKGWLKAEAVTAGDRLRRLDGGWAAVLAIERVVLDAPVGVYNFTVAGVHTYFVLEVGVLVHNCLDEIFELQSRVEEPVFLYHGTTKNHISSFINEGFKVGSIGGDFGPGFYVTRRRSEGIKWATVKAGYRREPPRLIQIEVSKREFDALIANVDHPNFYRGGSVDREMIITRSPHSNPGFDYVYGPVSFNTQGFEQLTFKSQQAFDLLNLSPFEIYKVSMQGNIDLKTIERIIR